MTKIVAKHTLKFGYEVVRTTYDSLVETSVGHYTMAGSDLPSAEYREPFANFLLGTVGSAQFTQAKAEWQPRWWSHSCTCRTIVSRFAL